MFGLGWVPSGRVKAKGLWQRIEREEDDDVRAEAAAQAEAAAAAREEVAAAARVEAAAAAAAREAARAIERRVADRMQEVCSTFEHTISTQWPRCAAVGSQ